MSVEKMCEEGLMEYENKKGIDWKWQSRDGAFRVIEREDG